LPEEPNSFVGRERELSELRRFVSSTRALTLCGAGGIGKTRLALHGLAMLVDEFADGVWFVELGDLGQPDLVVPRVAAAIGVDEERGRPLLDTLADVLRPRRLLIALDNCEHLIDACARVCERLLASSPGLRLIATSREPLHVAAETVWQVPPLSVPPLSAMAGSVAAPATAAHAGTAGTAGGSPEPVQAIHYEAIRLFAERAAAAQPGFSIGPANTAAVAALCRALDGIPLAIELAAAWVRVLSVEQIAERLADRFGLLTTGGRTAPPRHRTLRATIDWSHDLLTTAEQLLLRRLSVFAGWSLEMAEQVCADDGLPAARMLDVIAALVDKSLVAMEPEVLGQARYRLLETIREYAAARLARAGESVTFQRRLRDYTLAVAERNLAIGMAQVAAPWSARVAVFRRFDVDAGNVWQVLSRCLGERDAETGLRICTAIRPCWIVRGAFAEGGEWLDSFLALDAPEVAAGVRGPALVGRAQLALSTDPARAAWWAKDGLDLCRGVGEQFWTAAALNLLSEIALHTGQTDEAAGHAQEALSVARDAGDGWNEGYALGTGAAVAALGGKLREAQQLAEASIAVMRRIDQQWGLARTLLGLGDLARLRGDPGDARERYLAALPILRDIDSRPEIARCLAGLARVALDQDATGSARRYLTESVRLSHSTGARIGVARGLEAFAALAVQEGRPDRGVRLIAAAAALREEAGLPPPSGARTQRFLAAARGLGDQAIRRLWAQGRAMTGDAAVALALDVPVAGADATGVTGTTGTGDTGGAAGNGARAADGAAGGAADPAAAGAARTGAVGAGPAATSNTWTYLSATTLPGVLTPREHQVAALVAAGRSNKAIAAELFISPATAARHVANILAKLGFTSRTQIAAWAADRPLDRREHSPGIGDGKD
jgi:predicted ATPase/DNA-binding CsgD family transcriptional regulator